ncbi:recombination protein RecO [Helicobacter sp. 13S00482-2]|uniref:recombination protein RecO n=1 Tax=Helicobacter sp. 13S00482-2 TaxID=1476200 RepID=UPI000BA54244|nr:recombination protein RecO [Helicobacter sp. 13S00482-2]PAF53101.1 recombination protein RecO [Helicobacter sp. 13S00482-2]
MQGYILKIIPLKNEDIIAHILTPNSIKRLYRFYGARHSIIHLGKKIDFEEQENGIFLSRLRNVIHLGYRWENDLNRVYVWQRFIQMLHTHLFDVYEIDRFYFEMLESGAKKIKVQNPLRVALEMYAELLGFEGRDDKSQSCFVCGGILEKKISLGRAFLLGHPNCLKGNVFDIKDILDFLHSKQTLHLDDDTVEKMWGILLKGI